MPDLGVACPWPSELDPCPTRLQAVMFEGRLLLAAGIAGHLQMVHKVPLQTAWRWANEAAG